MKTVGRALERAVEVVVVEDGQEEMGERARKERDIQVRQREAERDY